MSTTLRSDRDWIESFRAVYDHAVDRYRGGQDSPEELFTQAQVEFLASIGASPRELFDFVEDWVDDGEPDYETVLAVTSMRHEYMLSERGEGNHTVPSVESFPSGWERLKGIPWLPRIIAKARAKLRGELPQDLMYGCGADRPFLRKVGLEPAEFLRLVWEAGSNDDHIAVRVEESASAKTRSA